MIAKIKLASNGQYYFNICANNSKIIATSELYTQKHNAVKAINVLINGMGMVRVKDETK
jgi:uncharacterized protein YegP (UPF0339 family)